jgi:adenylate cyclase
MDCELPVPAWLERADGSRVPVSSNLAIGRSAGNQLVLEEDRVSRRHALIHVQSAEFWLVDLGSRNGTYVNDRRVQQPVRLREGDGLRMGGGNFTFHQPDAAPCGNTTVGSTAQTLADVRSADCWLLVADVIGSTQLLRKAAPDEVAMLMGQWFLQCKQLVEAAGGTMNKYLGDGFLAFWHANAVPAEAIAKSVEALRKMQQAESLSFRFVLHRGRVFLGGAASLGEESLSGPEVNFVFRMEKLAGALGETSLVSETAHSGLGTRTPASSVGRHPVPGFEGDFFFHSL